MSKGLSDDFWKDVDWSKVKYESSIGQNVFAYIGKKKANNANRVRKSKTSSRPMAPSDPFALLQLASKGSRGAFQAVVA
jgi:hypothetical protein